MAKSAESKKIPTPNLKIFHKEVNRIIDEKGIRPSEFIRNSKYLTKATGNRLFDFKCTIKPKRETLYHFFIELNLDLEERRKLFFLVYPQDELYFQYMTNSNMTGEALEDELYNTNI